jgi:hypothetical protein
MQIIETYELTEWIKEEVANAGIVQKYNDLFAVLNHNANRPPNEPTQSFKEQKRALFKALSTIDFSSLSLSQINALEVLNINHNIGDIAIEKIELILSNTLDIADVASQVQIMINELNTGIKQSNQLNTALVPLIETYEKEIDPEKVLTRVIFEHDASIGNIVHLKDWSDKWFHIGRGFAIGNGQTPEDIQIIGASKGSIVIELLILAGTAIPIAKAINMTLDSMVKYREFQLKSIEYRKMKEDNPKLDNELEEEAVRWEKRAEQLKKDVAEDITEEMKKALPNYQKDNQRELGKAVTNLVEFISLGGDVDCVISGDIDEDKGADEEEAQETARINAPRQQLRDEFENIRQLRETLKLEHNQFSTKDSDEE